MPLHTSPSPHHHHYIPSHVPIMDGDAGRRYSGAQRHKQQHAENPSTSPRSPHTHTHTPYPLPYHHHHHLLLLPKAPPQRHSLPDVVVSPPARTRFVSLPLPLPRAEITESDRLERACGRVPAALLRVPLRDEQPPPSSPHQPRRDAPMAPKWPHWTLVLRIKRVLRRDGKDVRDYVEAAQIDEMFRRDVEERARRAAGKEARSSSAEADFGDENSHVFGVPLNETVLRAPATAILGGYRHDLPLVVFLCVEELYRTGIYKSGLFRDLPNRQRHHELRTLFDTAPAFGEGMNLRAESTADICALLLTYLKELPEPVLPPCLFNAFWNWCVRPSVKREDERTHKEQDEEEELRARFFQTGQRPMRPSRRVQFEKARLRAAQDEAAETGQLAVARDLLRLLPTHSFSLIVYLCAFFTQVPLCPENGIAFEDIGRIFGPAVFGGPVPAARRMMVWFLKRWNRVSDGLLDPEPDDHRCSSTSSDSSASSSSSSASALKAGRDARLLERADSFELLAPEEGYDEELLEFRNARMDVSLDERERRRHLLPHSGSDSDAPGWLTTNDRGRERSLEPDDSISQVSAAPDVVAPQSSHVFAARRSSASQCDAPEEAWGFADAQLLIALSRLHEARSRIDKLEHAVVDAATQSERACEKLAYAHAAHKEVKLVEREEANELVKNVCAMLKGVVQPALA